jgi:Domain of unknown function (DUF4190)
MGSATTSQVQGAPKTSSMAFSSLMFGIVGIVFFGIIFGPLAIIFGAIAIKRINEKPLEYQGRGMARAGIICGIIGIVVYIVIIILVATG